MGNRLSNIVTRTGDDGTTGLGDGSRVRKDDLRIDVIGDVDELNSHIGVLRTCMINAQSLIQIPFEIDSMLNDIQHDLFDIGGELCMPDYKMITQQHIKYLDQHIVDHNAHLPRLAEFILPGGNPAAAYTHICRTVARRAERHLVALCAVSDSNISAYLRLYLNRLSDLLFVLSRRLNRVEGSQTQGDVLWIQRKNATSHSDN